MNERIKHLAHFIPSQGPLKDFIHHNTLHAYQEEPFDRAIRRASEVNGSNFLLSSEEIKAFLRSGKISAEGSSYVGLDLNQEPPSSTKPSGWVKGGLRQAGFGNHQVRIEAETQAPLFRILSFFLDQGISSSSQNRQGDLHLDFWNWIRKNFQGTGSNFKLFRHPWFQKTLEKDPESVLEECLDMLVDSERAKDRYLLELLLSHSGWSGLVHQVEVQPSGLFHRRSIRLVEMAALELMMDVVVSKSLPHFQRFSLPAEIPSIPEEWHREADSAHTELRKYHDALEWSHYLDAARKIENKKRIDLSNQKGEIQTYFCLDDRFCSVRRHLEIENTAISTYGAAGFYGLDCSIQDAGYPYSVQSCPAVLKPSTLIREEFVESGDTRQHPHGPFHHQEVNARLAHPILSWAWTHFLGVQSLSLLVQKVVFKKGTEVKSVSAGKKLLIDFEQIDGVRYGYTTEEMAQKVSGFLRNTGFRGSSADQPSIVVTFGHKASSNNNPHYAAYDCGACSGRSGAQNARSFAMMANRQEVRDLVRAQGLVLPENTVFIGGIYDTTRDEYEFFDTDALSPAHRELLEELDGTLKEVVKKNALERCRRFELAPTDLNGSTAHRHVIHRSEALFEPRPELNHATNSLSIVGRRSLTQGLNFDRRAFLHSYDPETDPRGEILTGILNAVVPVCGGINLEYYFSRMDNEVYGAGTKLPHNVVGLFGVANGAEGDLRTGLPLQMIELHDPVRLLVLVEQEPEVALQAIQRNPATYEWVKNDWVRYATVSPSTGKVSWFLNEQWTENGERT